MLKIRSSTWVFVTFFAAILALFAMARVLFIVLFVSTLQGILLSPLVDRLSKKIHRGVVSFGVLVGFLVLLLVVTVWVIANIVPGFGRLAHEVPAFFAQIRNFPNTLPIPAEAAGYVDGALREAANTAIAIAKRSAEAMLGAVSSVVELIAIPVITFYFLKDGSRLFRYFTKFLKPDEAGRVHLVVEEMKTVLRRYIQGQCTISLISAFAVFSYFMLTGLPYASVFAAISAAAELAPVVGPAVASILASVFAYSHSPFLAMQTLIFYIVLLKINHNFVYPFLIGKATKLHPVVIVSGVLLLGHLFGVLGMVLAVPVLAIVRILFEHYAGGNFRPAERLKK